MNMFTDYCSVIELQFLLLKHFVIASSPPSTRGSAPGMSRANSSNSFASGKENEVATVVLDDMDLTQLLSSPSNLPEKYAAHVTWRTQSTDAKIYTPHLSGTSSELVVKRKYAECVVHPDINQSNIQYKDETVERQIKEAQDWFTQHREVKPLVKTWFKRTRFVGRTPSGHAWAFLDRDIKMRALHGAPQWSTDELSNGKDVVGFPHALCVIRWEGDMVPAVVDEINRSNLVSTSPSH